MKVRYIWMWCLKSCEHTFHLFLTFPLLHRSTIWTAPFQRHIQDTQQHLSCRLKNTHTNKPLADVLLWIHLGNSPLTHSSWIHLLTTLLMEQYKTQKKSTWQSGDPHINDMWMLLCRRPSSDSYSERPVLEQLQNKAKQSCFSLDSDPAKRWLASLAWVGRYICLWAMGLTIHRSSFSIKRLHIPWAPMHVQETMQRNVSAQDKGIPKADRSTQGNAYAIALIYKRLKFALLFILRRIISS